MHNMFDRIMGEGGISQFIRYIGVGVLSFFVEYLLFLFFCGVVKMWYVSSNAVVYFTVFWLNFFLTVFLHSIQKGTSAGR
jgi:putative flippase GtrA